MKKTNQILSLLLAIVMVFGMLPVSAIAAVDSSTNLCEHHTAHSSDVCGYAEGVDGVACGHIHDETACYTQQTTCTHTHEEACYPATESEEAGTEPIVCTHACSEESGCITSALACSHTSHDDTCGYVEAVTAVPCGYVCEICAAASIAEDDTCICDTKCTDVANADCMVCSAEGAVLAEVCTGQAADTTKYWVSVTASPFDGSGGTVTGQGQYAPGEQVTISIVPNTESGYCAAQWGLANIGDGVISAIYQKTSHTFTMPENAVQISITFTQHSYITYSDLENGTHQNKCFYCMTPHGEPEAHVDAHGGGDGTTPPDGYCDLCSAELHTHSYSSEWSSDEEGHWHECECGVTSDFEEHISSGAATEDAAEVCTVCGYVISPKLTHTHSYSTDWSKDASGHWHECECGEKSAFAEHTSSGAATEDKAEVCTVCGYEISPKLTHTHSYSTDWSKDASGHWHECECGEKSAFAEHTSSGAATENKAEVCTVCGYEISPKLTHTHSYNTLKYDGSKHWYECSCGAKSGETAHSYKYECTAKCSVCDYERLATHVYDSYCDSVCNFCGYERTVSHSYGWLADAEGHEEKCSVCGDVKIAKAAHTSSGAATEESAEVCTVCGYVIAPKLTTYTLTLNYNNNQYGVSVSPSSKTITGLTPGTVVDLSKYWPTAEQMTKPIENRTYYFRGFDQTINGYTDAWPTVTVNSDLTLNASWVTTEQITVDLNSNGGTLPYAITRENAREKISRMNYEHTPTRSGYDFEGWSLENDGTADSGNSEITADCTLYAIWKQVHNISADWSYDEEVHYHTCDCGERHDETEHSFYIGSRNCYKCGYIQGMPIGSDDKTSVEFVPVTGTTLPEGSYLDVKAYEVVEKDVEAIFEAAVADEVSSITEITLTNINTKPDNGWKFSEQYTLRSGDKVTIGGITYIVLNYSGDEAILVCNNETYILNRDKGLCRRGELIASYSTDTEIVNINGVQYIITLRSTSGDQETVYLATMDGKSAGVYYANTQDVYFYPDCTPEALTPKVSVGGVVAVESGQFLVNTSEGVKVANTIWANDVSLHGADGLPISGIVGTFTVSGIQYTAVSAIAAHIGADSVDIGRFDDSVFNIRDVDDFSPFVLLDVTDFEAPAIELAGITVLDEAPGEDAPTTDPGKEEPGDDVSYGWIIAIIAAIVAVIGGGAAWVIFRKKRRTN